MPSLVRRLRRRALPKPPSNLTLTYAAALVFSTVAASAQTAIDFSYAGYGGGEVPIPAVPVVLSVSPSGGDDTAMLQAAILHGAVILRPGRYHVAGQLRIESSGAVLRGQGDVTIVATGKSRRTLIEVGAVGNPTAVAPIQVMEDAPAGATKLTLASIAGLRTGDRVVITRPSTTEWIDSLKMRGLPGTFANQRLDWTSGSRDLFWDRSITAIDAEHKQITVDAPITTALEKRYGGGTVAKASGPFPSHIGIENLVLESEFDPANPLDEEHSWIAIALDHVEDAWVRGVVARHFVASAVRVGHRARRVTIENCQSEKPVSEIAGYRRQSFLVDGQQVLVRQCRSEHGMNDFAVGLLAAGPNVFLDCTATGALGPSGSFESWASGVLYERVRVDGAGISLANDSSRAQGAGWTAANSLVSAEPLYEDQLFKRTGRKLTPPSSTAADAALPPGFTMPSRSEGLPIPRPQEITIVNGRFVADRKVVWGGTVNDGWWRGQANPVTALDAGGVAITRFVPGETGPGLTEDLPALADKMAADGTPFYQNIPGLWYDRRRDEHSIVSRTDGNVWAPFYEMPWARSGKGTASDGLSKYDLSRFNPWYYERLREFGRQCDAHGFVLYHNIYNTHNVLEIPPHWIDYPWRPANNVNDTGLPEPPPIEPGNHIHVANQVYDVTNPVRRQLHRALILHELDELLSVHNLIFNLGFQFAGPLAFQEFFQDTVAEWERRTGRTVRIQLATSKDITDAILADPVRARQVAVIDMRYWQYRPDGSLWAPPGGKNLAFREMIGIDFKRPGDTPPDTTPLQVYRQVREYHDKYPDKAIVAWNGGAGPIPVLMAGGAQALLRNPSGGHGQGRQVDHTTLDTFVRDHLAAILMKMRPRDGWVEGAADNWCLADDRGEATLLYSLAGPSIRLLRTVTAQTGGLWFDPRNGKTKPASVPANPAVIEKPTAEPWLLLLRGSIE